MASRNLGEERLGRYLLAWRMVVKLPGWWTPGTLARRVGDYPERLMLGMERAGFLMSEDEGGRLWPFEDVSYEYSGICRV